MGENFFSCHGMTRTSRSERKPPTIFERCSMSVRNESCPVPDSKWQ